MSVGQHDAELCPWQSKRSGHPDYRRAYLAPVVEHGEGKRKPVGGLADDDHFLAHVCKDAVGPFGERLLLEARERFGRPEARAAAPDEEDAGWCGRPRTTPGR